MHRAENSNRRGIGKRGHSPSLKTAIAIISQHRKALAAVGARKDVVASLDGALELLNRNIDLQGNLFGSPVEPVRREEYDPLEGRDPRTLSLDEVRQIAADDSVGRRVLERIAIERFAVPKGSMRSFPNISLLREKLMTLVRNNAAHNTISLISQADNKG